MGVNTSNYWPQAICISSTRELAIQITKVVDKSGKYFMKLHSVLVCHGDHAPKHVHENVAVGTPDKLVCLTKPKCDRS